MEELDYWRLYDELKIVQAAMLIVGEASNLSEYIEGWEVEKRPEGYETAKTDIVNALKRYIENEEPLDAGIVPLAIAVGVLLY